MGNPDIISRLRIGLTARESPGGLWLRVVLRSTRAALLLAKHRKISKRSPGNKFHFGLLTPKSEVGHMCEKCVEIDDRIDRYLRLSQSVNDQRTLAGIVMLIEKLEAEKAALHPEQQR